MIGVQSDNLASISLRVESDRAEISFPRSWTLNYCPTLLVGPYLSLFFLALVQAIITL